MMETDVQEQLDDLARQVQRLRCRHRTTPRDCLGVSRFVLQTALSILSLSNMSFDMATAWIMDRNRKGVKVPKHIRSMHVRHSLEEIVLEASAEEIVAWGDREFCSNHTSLRVATDYVRKCDLLRSVTISNTVYGRPLASVLVIRDFYAQNTTTETRGAVLRSTARNTIKPSRHRMWAVRWRKKYGAKSGKIRFGEPLSEDNKRRKVRWEKIRRRFFRPKRFGSTEIVVPFRGTKKRTTRHIYSLWDTNVSQ